MSPPFLSVYGAGGRCIGFAMNAGPKDGCRLMLLATTLLIPSLPSTLPLRCCVSWRCTPLLTAIFKRRR